MGSDSNCCLCSGVKQEKNIPEINSDSYKVTEKENFQVEKRKSKSMHNSKNYVTIIDIEKMSNNDNLDNNNITKNSNNNFGIKKKNSTITKFFAENNTYNNNKKGSIISKSIKEKKSESSSLSSSSSYSSSSSEEEEENEEDDEGKENNNINSNESYFITEKIKNNEKLFKNKLDIKNWKKFYDPQDNKIIKLLELGNDKKKIKSYCELIIKIKNKDCFYKGQIDEDNNLCGFGELYYKSGEKYEGIFNNGKLNGWGRHINSKGICFEGLFRNNVLTGKGIIIKTLIKNYKKINYLYEGDIKNFIKEGKGIEKTDEYIYEGEFKNDFKDGKGKITYQEKGEIYEGDFLKDEITGNGCYIFNNKNSYKGEFLEGKMHGKGIYQYLNGNEYEGEYNNNVKEGNGEYRWNNGQKYKGEFSRGTPHGKGILTINGIDYEVKFEYGKFIGNINNLSKSKLDYNSEN